MAFATVDSIAPSSPKRLAHDIDRNCSRMEAIQRELQKLQAELQTLARETAGLNTRLVERIIRDAS